MIDDFDAVYNKINTSFEYVKDMMGVMYDRLINDPTNEEIKEIYEGLGDAALRILSSQRDFIDVYATGEMKDYYMERVEDKINYISSVQTYFRGSRTR